MYHGQRQASRWVLLSDGARPTEDIYFMSPAAPWLRCGGGSVVRLDTRRWRSPALCWPWLGRLLRGAQVLVCRSLSEPWLDALETRRVDVASVRYLIDDDIEAASLDDSLPEQYRKRMAWIARASQPRLLALADEVIVTSASLAVTMRACHRRVVELPPVLLAPLPSGEHFVAGTRWRLGYHGTRAHRSDLEHIAPALCSVHDAYPRLDLIVMLGQATPEALAERGRIQTPGPLSWDAYRQHLRRRRLHIGVAPLLPTPFNAGKSHLKFLDIAAMGGVGVYSRRSPYANIVSDGEDGLLADDDPDDWRRCLVRLLETPGETRRMAARAADKARDIGDPGRARRFWLQRRGEG
ncbi:glycosyltransferase [Halomonas sp. V046]|uniref:glycosyltransferase n=1 Tax=Halomonas sp. V046 TaxID=3459611 RepID=UPI004044709E